MIGAYKARFVKERKTKKKTALDLPVCYRVKFAQNSRAAPRRLELSHAFVFLLIMFCLENET